MEPKSNNTDEATHKPVEIEATWAPKDPRDRMDDPGATPQQRRMSVFRILASFHPVLNGPILLYEFFKMLGPKKSLALTTILSSVVLYAFLR